MKVMAFTLNAAIRDANMTATEHKRKILVVDDERDVTDLLDYHLRLNGYQVQVINDPLLIMGTARHFHPDLILLDIMMPELSGLQICRMLRADTLMRHVAVIFLTARGEAEDRIKGLESGADDYICKPFDMREVLLRIQSVFKRKGETGQAEGEKRLQAGGVELDVEKHELRVAGKAVELTATEFRLLRLLLSRKGRVQSRENLLVNVWNYESDVETRTVDTHIRRLREKLGAHGDLIETVRGVGYRVANA